jgi:hypothetical protein
MAGLSVGVEAHVHEANTPVAPIPDVLDPVGDAEHPLGIERVAERRRRGADVSGAIGQRILAGVDHAVAGRIGTTPGGLGALSDRAQGVREVVDVATPLEETRHGLGVLGNRGRTAEMEPA